MKSGCGGVGGAVESEQPDAAEPVVGVRVLGIDFENAGEVCGSLPAIACLLCEEPEIVKRIVVVRIGGDRFFKPVFRPFRILLRPDAFQIQITQIVQIFAVTVRESIFGP